jgi:uncharacterized repeat protein (TIGR01451 family)
MTGARNSGVWFGGGWFVRSFLMVLALGACLLLVLSGLCGGEEETGLQKSSIKVSENNSLSRPVLEISRSTFGGGFTKITVLRNSATGTAIKESYLYGDSLDREAAIGVDGNGTEMEVESTFDGTASLGVFKKSSPNGTPQETPAFAAFEDYFGSFKISEQVDDYGSNIVSERSVSGTGFVAVNKKVGDEQKVHESGTGSYQSEERIETYTNYIAKELSLAHQPTSFAVGGGPSTNLSLKWSEGIYSKRPADSYIGEEYSGIDRLDKTTVAFGLGEIETEANFSGTALYRVVSEADIDMDEQYRGDYSLQRNVKLHEVSGYGQPHLNVEKEGTLVDEEERTLATYVIAIENDGDRTLEPVLVRDLFPPGAVLVSSNLRPTLTSGGANWSLTHISPGDVIPIELTLDVTNFRGAELVNWVEAFGGDGEGWVYAANFSAVEIKWLSCCSAEGISVAKTGTVDEVVPNLVTYSLEVKNLGDDTLVATVTDRLSDGMRFIDSSPTFATYEDGVVTWNLIDLGPGEERRIVYEAEALWSGRFVNLVEVDPRSVDGTSLRPVYAKSVVEVEEFEGERPRPGWQPPDCFSSDEV